MENYQILRRLHKTLYGDILLCRSIQTSKKVAIKRIVLENARNKCTVTGQKPIHEDAFRERRVNRRLRKCKSRNILRMLEDFEQGGVMHLVFEYCSSGDLFSKVESGSLEIDDIRRYFKQIVNGLCDLHQHGYAHCDLSLENILLDAADQCKLCDFGLVRKVKSKQTVVLGKSFYLAPEMIAGEEYHPEVADMWSLGVVLFICLTGSPLVEKACLSDPRFQFIRKYGVRRLLSAWQYDSVVPEAAKDLLEGLLKFNPKDRMTMDELVRNTWIKEAMPQDDETISDHTPSYSSSIWQKLLKQLHLKDPPLKQA